MSIKLKYLTSSGDSNARKKADNRESDNHSGIGLNRSAQQSWRTRRSLCDNQPILDLLIGVRHFNISIIFFCLSLATTRNWRHVRRDDSIGRSERSVASIRDVVCGNSCKTLKSEAIDENNKRIFQELLRLEESGIRMSRSLEVIRIDISFDKNSRTERTLESHIASDLWSLVWTQVPIVPMLSEYISEYVDLKNK